MTSAPCGGSATALVHGCVENEPLSRGNTLDVPSMDAVGRVQAQWIVPPSERNATRDCREWAGRWSRVPAPRPMVTRSQRLPCLAVVLRRRNQGGRLAVPPLQTNITMRSRSPHVRIWSGYPRGKGRLHRHRRSVLGRPRDGLRMIFTRMGLTTPSQPCCRVSKTNEASCYIKKQSRHVSSSRSPVPLLTSPRHFRCMRTDIKPGPSALVKRSKPIAGQDFEWGTTRARPNNTIISRAPRGFVCRLQSPVLMQID